MALPNVQTAQYGDRAALEKLGGVRQTNDPAADVQTVKNMGGGRPSGSVDWQRVDPVKIAQDAIARMRSGNAASQTQSGIPAEHEQLLSTVAYLHKVAEDWIRIANQPDSGPMTRAYAVAAVRTWRQALEKARMTTPFFDGVE